MLSINQEIGIKRQDGMAVINEIIEFGERKARGAGHDGSDNP